MNLKKVLVLILAFTMMIGAVACGKNETAAGDANAATGENKAVELTGTISIDGSSTVFPIAEAIAEEFMKENKSVKITVGFSGTGGGFEKFFAGETIMSNASRHIKDKEIAKAKEAGVEYIELSVAYDGLSVLVNPANTWVDYLTVDELKKIWAPDSTVKTWKDVRAEWPAEEIKLYAPGTDSGTFDYFTEAINGKSGAIRPDFTASEDDNVLVQGIAGDKNSLGFFGFAYYMENKDKLKIVKIDGGKGPVEPTFETIENGTYSPLSRPMFVYVNKKALAERPEVKAYVEYMLTVGKELVPEVGYVKLPEAQYKEELNKLK